jgi:6,7-dimethyl-8-ribityllumazine synthase
MIRKFFFLLALVLIVRGYVVAQERPRVAIVTSVYHETITSKLLEAATECLYKHGLNPENISIAYVPGSFEIPYTVKLLAETKKFDAIICLGAIITSDNPGWTYVADQVSKNVAHISLAFDIPVTWGVFLFDSKEVAEQEVSLIEKNDGWAAAQAAIDMIALTKQIIEFAQIDPSL